MKANLKATLAIAKASFRSMTRTPSAIIFNFAFPIVFMVAFGFIRTNGLRIDVGVLPSCNKENPLYQALKQNSILKLIEEKHASSLRDDLKNGKLDAIINITKKQTTPTLKLDVHYSAASSDKADVFKVFIRNILCQLNVSDRPLPQNVAIQEATIQGRTYQVIDFLLPGQLGFSLLSTSVFGTAFVFLTLRSTLVIKRFFATPIKRYNIILGEGLARICFSMIGALFIITLGHYVFGFTLVHGFATLVSMLFLAVLGVILFMGFGFAISGIAKSEHAVPPIANVVTLPQFLLSGTFFSPEVFPTWLQRVSKTLPLTYFNEAMRKISFEGASIWDVHYPLSVLLIWTAVIYAIAIKTFRWED